MQIFISKELKEVQDLSEFCKKNNWNLIAESLIDFHSIDHEIQREIDAVFFSSPRSVKFCNINQEQAVKLVLIAIGESTAISIKAKYGKVDFICKQSGDFDKVAQQIDSYFSGKRILFPLSSISERNVLSKLQKCQTIPVVAYETFEVLKSIPTFDIGIFTSPSSCKAFLKANHLTKEAILIAWGKSTEKYLKDLSLPVSKSLKNSTIEELLICLKEYL